MAQHSTTAGPCRIRLHNSDLACDVQRVYAYRARCACGWKGPRRERHAEAREDAKLHRAESVIVEVTAASRWAEAS